MMRAGSVIVDLAAEAGGNCELTRKDETYVDEESGVTIVGITNMTSLLADQSSTLYATNIKNLLAEMGGATKFTVDRSNDIVGPTVVATDGHVVWQPPQPIHAPAPVHVNPNASPTSAAAAASSSVSPPEPSPSPTAPPHAVQHPDTIHSPTVTMQPIPAAESKEDSASANKKESALGGASSSPPVAAAKPSSSERDRLLPNAPSSAGYASTASNSSDSIAIDMDPDAGRIRAASSEDGAWWWAWVLGQVVVLTAFFAGLSFVTPPAFHLQLLVFVLSVVVGYNLVWSVTPALHTPLMSVTNAM